MSLLSAVKSQTNLVSASGRASRGGERDSNVRKKKSHQWFVGAQLLLKFHLRSLMNPHIHQASFQLIKATQKAEEADASDESLGKLTNL